MTNSRDIKAKLPFGWRECVNPVLWLANMPWLLLFWPPVSLLSNTTLWSLTLNRPFNRLLVVPIAWVLLDSPRYNIFWCLLNPNLCYWHTSNPLHTVGQLGTIVSSSHSLLHVSLIGLLYTILVLFASRGHRVVHQIVSMIRVAAPLIVYFIIVFSRLLSYAACLASSMSI